MGKELRVTAAPLKLHKYPKLDGSLWGLQNPQPFFPPLEKLFKTETLASLSDYGVKLNEEVEAILDENTIRTTRGRTATVHRKITMILSPFKWMRGDYGALGLPKPEEIANDMQEKLQSPNTAAYVGALTSIALSESGCAHFPKVYGVYVGMAKDHTIDISDDYEDLTDRRWFADNLGKTFEMKLRTPEVNAEFKHTRSQRPHIILGDEALLDGIDDLTADHITNPSVTSREMSDDDGSDSSFLEDKSSEESDNMFEIESCDCESEDDEEDEEDDSSDEPFAWATFHDVPVVTTVMEKCEGTLYDLYIANPEPEKHAAWMAQIIFALAYAQRNYGFVHNDLHGNNVMYVKTEDTHFNYKHAGVFYRVPTFGYLIKIIDFDRSIVSIRLAGMKEPRQFVSSQFQQDEEASGQYNMEPFFSQSYPHIPPNPSFDLSRFATSVFWDLFEDGPEAHSTHPLFSVFKQWMMQTDGTSVLFRPNKSDDHDRYHGFHLYKAIARYCKDAVPRREIAKLGPYRVENLALGSPCLILES